MLRSLSYGVFAILFKEIARLLYDNVSYMKYITS